MVEPLSKLKWRCRRGMRELDTLMSNWLDRRYDSASDAEREAFEQLLSWQDPELIAHINARQPMIKPDSIDDGTDQHDKTGTGNTAKDRHIEIVLEQIRSLKSAVS